jgi:exodeoxyribonuclease VIII
MPAPEVNLEQLMRLSFERKLTGFFHVTDEDYHRGPGYSSSDICNLLRSPAHYRAAKAYPKRTPAMELGTQIHEFMLQPERFHARYLVEPEITGPKNRNPWKADWEAFKARCEAEGKAPMDRQTFAVIEGVAGAVCDHPSGAAMLETSVRELAAYVQDPDTGLVRKAKADLALPWGLADLKTTDDARQGSFIRTVRAFHYHTKAAWYLDVFNALLPDTPLDAFVWIAAEKAPPYGIACYAASPAMLESGRKTYQKALDVLSNCIETNVWPCYEGEILPLEFPDYMMKGDDL